MKQLVCRVRGNVINLFDESKEAIINNTIQTHKPNNVIHFGRKCPPVNFYLKNGRYDIEMSQMRKDRITKMNIPVIREIAMNNLQTRLDLNLLK